MPIILHDNLVPSNPLHISFIEGTFLYLLLINDLSFKKIDFVSYK